MKICLLVLSFALVACNNMKDTSSPGGSSSYNGVSGQSSNVNNNWNQGTLQTGPVTISLRATVPAKITDNSIIPRASFRRSKTVNGRSCEIEVKQNVEMKIAKVDEDHIRITTEGHAVDYEKIGDNEWEAVIRDDKDALFMSSLEIADHSIKIEMKCDYK